MLDGKIVILIFVQLVVNVCKSFLIFSSIRYIILNTIKTWLVPSKDDLNCLVRLVHGPSVVLFVVEEVGNVKDMAHVDETVTFVVSILMFVKWHMKIIKMILMILLKVSSNLFFCVPTRNVLNHEVCSVF